MRESLILQFGASELPPPVADVLEHAHSVARGAAAVICVARAASVRRELGEPAGIENIDADYLLALAGAAAALLGDRLESLSQHVRGESRHLSDDEQSVRGNA
ncbi:hypothetical protein [Pandoraea bronchicola]|uniref:Uncharacterized protein n=1 Tax=Pandoraea bronchicola TaxID=2508287 RepID=A0A5E5BRI4_9BURK|nr:hypothetical protein [Pandoraea bronchicola]VVE88409.1 hypothetical protein PBR20603_02364 [Pandoraea bronchicola]